MMERTERWRLLLQVVRDTYCGGNQAELARRIEKDATYVNRLFWDSSKKGAKGIGPEIMEACTRVFGLTAGFWEMEPAEALQRLQGVATGKTINLEQTRAKSAVPHWPYERVDLNKLTKLRGAAARAMENAMLAAASDWGADVRTGNRKTA